MATLDKQCSVARAAAPYSKLAPGPGRLPSDVADHQCARIHRAMIEIVAERGYRAVTARDVVRLAAVSTRSFYEHFASKEDCFVHTYELVARRSSRRIIDAQADEQHWRTRLERVVFAFVREVEADPGAARLALIEAPRVGPAGSVQVRRAERAFDSMLAESLARQPGGIEVPPLIVEAMVAGIAHVARTRLRAGRARDLTRLSSELVAWLLCLPGDSAVALEQFEIRSARRSGRISTGTKPSSSGGGKQSGDRALILAAAAKLIGTDPHTAFTIPRLRQAAGISRRKFENHFDSAEDCFIAALELHAGEALLRSASAQAVGRSWSGGIYRAVDALCDEIAEDRFLAGVCVGEGVYFGLNARRCHSRLAASFAEQLQHAVPQERHPTDLAAEASAGATWALLRRRIASGPRVERPQLAPTLSYVVLAPIIGAAAAMAAIRNEQHGLW